MRRGPRALLLLALLRSLLRSAAARGGAARVRRREREARGLPQKRTFILTPIAQSEGDANHGVGRDQKWQYWPSGRACRAA